MNISTNCENKIDDNLHDVHQDYQSILFYFFCLARTKGVPRPIILWLDLRDSESKKLIEKLNCIDGCAPIYEENVEAELSYKTVLIAIPVDFAETLFPEERDEIDLILNEFCGGQRLALAIVSSGKTAVYKVLNYLRPSTSRRDLELQRMIQAMYKSF